jgi:RND family efflux transporter MFP subunit
MKLRNLMLCCLLWPILSSCQDSKIVKSAKVQRVDIEASVTSVNSGIVRSEKIAELAFAAVGRVKTLSVGLGDIVDKDFVIAELENSDAKSSLRTATKELERQRSLMTRGLSSQTLIEQAENAFEIAQIAYNLTLIRAPFKGQIVELNMEVGQLSQITTELRQALIRIVDLEPRYVRAEIDEVDLPRIKVGQAARVKVLANRKEPFDAIVRQVVPFVSSIREQDRTSEVELDLKTSSLLPVGASGDVEIIVEKKEKVLAVPLRAISSRSAQRFVYKLENGRAKKVNVTLGISNFDFAEVISELKEGDTVLMADDSVELEDGSSVEITK